MSLEVISIDEFFASMSEEERTSYEQASKNWVEPYEEILFCIWKNYQMVKRHYPRKGVSDQYYNRYCKTYKTL